MEPKSTFLKLNWKDIAKGFVMAIIGSLLTSAAAILTGGFNFSWELWQPALAGALVAGISYLIKNWLTNDQDQFLKK